MAEVENKTAESSEAMPEADAKLFEELNKGPFDDTNGWSDKAIWEDKATNTKGRIVTKKIGDNPNVWVRSVVEFGGIDEKVHNAYWANVHKYAQEKPDVLEAKATKKNADDSVAELYMVYKMPPLVSNRDIHVSIKSYKHKDKTVSVWSDITRDDYPSGKMVRMKMKSFSFSEPTKDGGIKETDYDQVDMGGRLPAKVVNMMVGNKADYLIMAKSMKEIASEKAS